MSNIRSAQDCRMIDSKQRSILYTLYAGTVIHLITPGNSRFQTNPLEHESHDRADNTVFSVCVINGKDMALQRQI